MNEASTPPDRHARNVAIAGFFVQLLIFAFLTAITVIAGSDAIATAARFAGGGVLVWAVLWFVHHQICRVNAEGLETAELKRARSSGETTALFELEDENLLLERNRLAWMVRWILPATTVILAAYFVIGHFVGWGWSLGGAFSADGLSRVDSPVKYALALVACALICFLGSRYTVGLARLPESRLLRAGAGCMSGGALLCLGLAIGLATSGTAEWVEPMVAYVIRVLLIVLGVEFAANFMLDFYRPRLPGTIARPAFDSRLLGLITEPRGIAKSVADAVNYQFGFEVSGTWFYLLLQRWMLPLLVTTLVIVMGLSSVVIVDADEAAVIERFGRRAGGPEAVLAPGLYLKWPYPIDIVTRAPVRRISEIVIGEALEEENEEHKAILWSEAHDFVPELMLLVAAPVGSGRPGEGQGPDDSNDDAPVSHSVAVSLLMASVPIQYRIKDIEQYLYRYDRPEKMLEAVAYQYLSEYAASVDIDTLMGPGRAAFNREFRAHLQTRIDELELGIELAFVGLRGAHPPAKDGVAKEFQSVVSAETKKMATIEAARGEAQRILTEVAGTRQRAEALDAAIRRRQALASSPNADPTAVAEAGQLIEDLLIGNRSAGIAAMSGSAVALLADARARASFEVSVAATKAIAFGAELAAYEAAPKLYRMRKMLEKYEDLGAIRKYMIVGDPSKVKIIYDPTQEAGLDQVLADTATTTPGP